MRFAYLYIAGIMAMLIVMAVRSHKHLTDDRPGCMGATARQSGQDVIMDREQSRRLPRRD